MRHKQGGRVRSVGLALGGGRVRMREGLGLYGTNSEKSWWQRHPRALKMVVIEL